MYESQPAAPCYHEAVHEVRTQTQDVVALATGYARTDDRVFVQNEITASVHVARSWDQNLTTCGWQYATAKRVNGAGYRILNTLVNLPGSMLCERCLTTERAVALVRMQPN